MMKSSKSAPVSAMSTSSDSDIISDGNRGAHGQTRKRGDNIASRKKYLQCGARGQTGKYGNSNDEVESLTSHRTKKKRRVTISKVK